MKCAKCGADIPDNKMQCTYCGYHVQMVPDFNPLDEFVTAEVRGSIHRNPNDEQRTRRQPHETNKESINARELALKKKRQAERRRELQRKKRNKILIFSGIGAILLIILIYVMYINSYSGLVGRGNKAFEKQEIQEAEVFYEKAITKKPEKEKAYIELSGLYIQEGEMVAAEETLLQGIDKDPSSLELSKALVELYILTGEVDKITLFLNECEDNKIVKELEQYVSEAPSFSLEEGEYDDVQELTLTSDGGIIYYTVNGAKPTNGSEQYVEPIQIGEGYTTIRAVTYNEEGVPSLESSKEYVVELPVEGAPIVNPSTGQYTEKQQISITVPEGYQAYYTMDGTVPTTESSLYKGPIDMPEGNTIFSAVLINGSNKTSDITKRNYDLVIKEEATE